jgi:hypothetical protein
MPMVGGKAYPYTEKGKEAAKKAAVAMKTGSKKAKKAFSGANSQLGSSY